MEFVRNHYTPKVYQGAWANEQGEICYFDAASREFLKNDLPIDNMYTENYYSVDGSSAEIEKIFNGFENEWKIILNLFNSVGRPNKKTINVLNNGLITHKHYYTLSTFAEVQYCRIYENILPDIKLAKSWLMSFFDGNTEQEKREFIKEDNSNQELWKGVLSRKPKAERFLANKNMRLLYSPDIDYILSDNPFVRIFTCEKTEQGCYYPINPRWCVCFCSENDAGVPELEILENVDADVKAINNCLIKNASKIFGYTKNNIEGAI